MATGSLRPDSKSIAEYMKKIADGSYKLPSFQRSFVWKDKQIKPLLDSIFHSYPIGTMLTIENKSELSQRNIEGSDGTSPTELLILDGQQRLTSIYQVIYNKGKQYADKRRNYYYLNIRTLYERYCECEGDIGKIDLVDDGILKIFRQAQPPSSIIDYNMPFWCLQSQVYYSKCIDVFTQGMEESEEKNFYKYQLLDIIKPFWDYPIQSMELNRDLDLSAVCRIFETLNSTGLRLDAFDICVAKFMADSVDIKELLDDAIIDPLTPYLEVLFKKSESEYRNRIHVLQTIALYEGKDNKQNHLFNLKTDLVKERWNQAIRSLNDVMEILDCLAQTKRTLEFVPYSVSIPVMAAALISANYQQLPVEKRADVDGKIRLYFLYTAFNKRYGEGAPNKTKNDYRALSEWIKTDNLIQGPEYFKGQIEWNYEVIKQFKKDTTNSITQAIRCLLFSNTPLDWLSGNKVELNNKNQHHIFAKSKKAYDFDTDSIFNIAYITDQTNNYVTSDRVPQYLTKISQAVRGEEVLKKRLRSSLIDDDAYNYMMSEDYESFIKTRANLIKKEIIDYGAIVIEGDYPGNPSDSIEDVSDE